MEEGRRRREGWENFHNEKLHNSQSHLILISYKYQDKRGGWGHKTLWKEANAY
jgi:hypothetical protein